MPEKMQRRGDIEESDSPWSSPVLIRTKNEDIRYCVHYRKLNDITRRLFPIDSDWRHFAHASWSQWFSTLDLKSGYGQVDLHPENN
jgi:hypothetical protein